jgi:hypothetical protein
MEELMASDWIDKRYPHSLNIIASLWEFVQYMEFLAQQQHLIYAVADMCNFSKWFLKDKLSKLYAGKDMRSRIKNSADLTIMDGFPTPDKIKHCVQVAIMYIKIVSDYVHEPNAEKDWAWARFSTMLLIGVIFFSTIAGKPYSPHSSRPLTHKEVHHIENCSIIMVPELRQHRLHT